MSRTKIEPSVRRDLFDAAQHKRDPKKYQCASCRNYFSMNALEVDHIVPESESTPDQRTDPANLQLLCNPRGSTRLNSCHKKKTAREARDRARRNKVPYRWSPATAYGTLSVVVGGFTWFDVIKSDQVAAYDWVQWSGMGGIAFLSTILVKNGFQHRRPRRIVSPAVTFVPESGLDTKRIEEAFRELVGLKGNVIVTASGMDQFRIAYAGTGFEDHKDEKRYEAVEKIQSKVGDRWKAAWETERDVVTMNRRPPLPKIIHHPGLEPGRPWHVLPVADGVAFNLMDTSHLLIIGETNSGKTAMLRAIIIAALDSASRGEVRLILSDPKRIEMIGFRDWKGVQRIVTKPRDLWDVAFMIQREMDRRYTLLEERKIPLSTHEKWICIFDEFKAYFDRVFDVWTSGEKDEDGEPFKRAGEKVPGAIRALADVIAMARKCGIHIIISTQSPDASMFGTSGVRQNLAGRATVGSIDGPRALMVYGRSDVGRDIPTNAKGRATVQIGDGEPVEIQTWFVPDPADADPNYKNTPEDWATLARLGMPKELIPQ